MEPTEGLDFPRVEHNRRDRTPARSCFGLAGFFVVCSLPPGADGGTIRRTGNARPTRCFAFHRSHRSHRSDPTKIGVSCERQRSVDRSNHRSWPRPLAVYVYIRLNHQAVLATVGVGRGLVSVARTPQGTIRASRRGLCRVWHADPPDDGLGCTQPMAEWAKAVRYIRRCYAKPPT